MHPIINKTYELLDTLNNSGLIKKLDTSKKNIIKNKKLYDLIKKGKLSQNADEIVEIKKILLKNIDYKNYIEAYDLLNLIVLKINKKFNSYFENRKCVRWE